MEARAADLYLTRDASLLILAGGRSTRMGRDKSALPVAGLTLLEWQVRRLGPDFAETIVAGAAAPVGSRGVPDHRTDAGPLAGIEAGLRAARSRYVFALACDLPRAGTRLAALLLARVAGHQAAVPRVGGRAQPTCAAYARTAAPLFVAYLDRGGRRATAMLDELDAVLVDEPALSDAGIAIEELADLDTPADYDAFVASLRA